MFIIFDKEKRRLCNDGKWRGFAMLGSEPGCVKFYKNAGHAALKSKVIRGYVLEIKTGNWLDASGKIYKDESQREEIPPLEAIFFASDLKRWQKLYPVASGEQT